MTYYADYQDDEVLGREPNPGRGARIAKWFVVAALLVIVVNIAIATLGSPKKVAQVPAPPPPPITTRPTAAAPSPAASREVRDLSSVTPSLPLPVPGAATVAAYPIALGALTIGGDVVLIDSDTARTIRVLVTHTPGSPVRDISWDAERGTMYYDRAGDCPTVWRYRLAFGLPELFSGGSHPVVSPDGARIAVSGSGCRPDGLKADGLAIFAANGVRQDWIPIGVGGDPEVTAGSVITDLDWRPDGQVIIATLAGDQYNRHRVVPVASGLDRLVVAAELPLLHPYDEEFYQLEYVDGRLLMVGSCCLDTLRAPSKRVVVREPERGSATSLTLMPVLSITADNHGGIRYLEDDPDAGGRLRAASLSPERALGSGRIISDARFLRIDW